jgi:hypothetical protein
MPSRIWEFLRPILAENGGWAIFIFTPRGRNHGWRLYDQSIPNDRWFSQLLTVEDTHAIPMEAVEEERTSGMPEELIAQEFFCSFDAPLVGAYYGPQLMTMAEENRIGKVPWEPMVPVTTAWDLGVRDATSIWFHQRVGREHRLIDYYHSSGVGLDHYAKVLSEKPYAYKEHLLPHDVTVRELGSGKSRLEVMRELGLRPRVVPKMDLSDGINAVRGILPQCWVDAEKCEEGLEGLRQYTKERAEGEQGPRGEPIFRDKPAHSWASHPADAIRTLACGLRRDSRGEPRQLAPKLAIV